MVASSLTSDLKSDIKKIAIALDASPYSIAALDEAVLLAEYLNAEVKVLCVEDINMIRAAEQPYSVSISPFNYSNKIATNMVSNLMRVQTNSARNALIYSVRGKKVKSSFEVKRGQIAEEVLKHSSLSDILVMGWAGWQASTSYFKGQTAKKQKRFAFPTSRMVKMGSSVSSVFYRSKIPCLVLRGAISDACFMSIFYDGSAEAKRNLSVAVNFFNLFLVYCKPSKDKVFLEVLITDNEQKNYVATQIDALKQTLRAEEIELEQKTEITLLDRSNLLASIVLAVSGKRTNLFAISGQSIIFNTNKEAIKIFNYMTSSLLVTA